MRAKFKTRVICSCLEWPLWYRLNIIIQGIFASLSFASVKKISIVILRSDTVYERRTIKNIQLTQAQNKKQRTQTLKKQNKERERKEMRRHFKKLPYDKKRNKYFCFANWLSGHITTSLFHYKTYHIHRYRMWLHLILLTRNAFL